MNPVRFVLRGLRSVRRRNEMRLRNRRSGTFVFRGRSYSYFHHVYNGTSSNERIVEIPLAKQLLADSKGNRILEVGNVLRHYGSYRHDVIDKYEARGVLNVNVLDFTSDEPYELIISVSTIEHVGWDEPAREPDKAERALRHLRGLLAPGGRLVVTFPVGHNPHLDRLVAEDRLDHSEVGYLRRVDAENRWEETTRDSALRTRYGDPFPFANSLVYAEFAADDS